ncbi:hypothetical protein P7C73_g5812, partial [Tremellales sp. Uapishka_1]
MPSESGDKKRKSEKRSSSESEKNTSATEVKKSASKAAESVRRAASTAGDALSSAGEGFADVFGGWKELDRTIKSYNPALYRFVNKSFLKNVSFANRASKFLLTMVALALLQSIVPIFQWPLDFLASFLSYLFLYQSGRSELQNGFESRSGAQTVKSLLTCFVLVSSMQLIPGFVFDTQYHFGALWNFFFPVLLFTTFSKDKPEETVANMICDSLFSGASGGLQGVTLGTFGGDETQTWSIIGAVVLGVLFYYLWVTGFLIAMLVTKNSSTKSKADTWYARWLAGGPVISPASSSSRSSSDPAKSSSRSSSRPAGDSKSGKSKKK